MGRNYINNTDKNSVLIVAVLLGDLLIFELALLCFFDKIRLLQWYGFCLADNAHGICHIPAVHVA